MPENPTPESPAAVPGAPRPGLNYTRTKPSVLRRSIGTVRRWARDTFSRDQLVAGVKQLAWVAPLTLLIWVYAEREQQDDETLRFPVTVSSTNPQFHARLVDPIDG